MTTEVAEKPTEQPAAEKPTEQPAADKKTEVKSAEDKPVEEVKTEKTKEQTVSIEDVGESTDTGSEADKDEKAEEVSNIFLLSAYLYIFNFSQVNIYNKKNFFTES